MNIQIFGTKKCKKTAKAERFFKERGIPFHFVNLAEKGISKGELQNVVRNVAVDEIIDRESKEFTQRNLQYMKFDPVEEILESPLILNTPIVRFGKSVTAGLAESKWKDWAKELKNNSLF